MQCLAWQKLNLILFPILTCIYYLKKVWETNNKANNKYLKSYNPKEESKHIIHLDKNNPYDYAMPKFFPTSEFKWIDPKEFD